MVISQEKLGKIGKKMNKMMFKNDQYVLIIETLVSIPQCHGIFSTITRIDWSFDVLGNM